MEKAFCPNCFKEAPYIVEKEGMVGRVKGRTYKFIGKQAKCKFCGCATQTDEEVAYNFDKLAECVRRAF